MSGTGNGTIVTLAPRDAGGTAFSARFISISGLVEYCDDLDNTSLEDLFEKMCAGDVVKTEPITVEYFSEYGEAPPVKGRYTMTITTKAILPLTNGATLTATVYVNRREGADLRNGQRRIGSVVIRCDGDTPPAYAPAT